MVIDTAPTVIKDVTVGAIYFGKNPLSRALPLAHVAKACANLYGADWKERLVGQDGEPI